MLGIFLVAAGHVGVNFFPETDQGTFTVSTDHAARHVAGARTTRSCARSKASCWRSPKSHRHSQRVHRRRIRRVRSAAATGRGHQRQRVRRRRRQEPAHRGITAIADEARQRLATVPGAKIQVNVSGADGAGQPVSILIQGPDNSRAGFARRRSWSRAFRASPGLRDVTNSAAAELPELAINVDRARAVQAGVSAQSVGSAVRLAYSGVVATKYLAAERPAAGRARAAAAGTRGPTVSNLARPAAAGHQRSGSAVADRDHLERHHGRADQPPRSAPPGDGRRQPGRRRRPEPGDASACSRRSSQLAAAAGLHRRRWAARAQQQAQSFGQLGAALGISILLAYLLMAVLYNSLIHPFVILFGLPLAFGGAVIATFLFHYTFNVFSMIGMILLVGLAIKNGILLVDRTNHNRARGMPIRAALHGSRPDAAARHPDDQHDDRRVAHADRLAARRGRRPARAAGRDGPGRRHLVDALTLVVVPVMYTLLDGFHSALGRRIGCAHPADCFGAEPSLLWRPVASSSRRMPPMGRRRRTE